MAKTEAAKNELAVVSRDKFVALRDDSDIAEAMAANIAVGEKIDESVLTRVPTPTGGGTTWVIPGVAGEESAQEIRGILVHHCRRGVLWPASTLTQGAIPVVISHDLQVGEQIGPIPTDMAATLNKCKRPDGTYDWPALYSVYGGRGSTDRRAKEQRVMFVLREGDPWPLIVVAQPGSLKTCKPFLLKLPVVYWRAVISLTLKKVANATGQPYAQIVPALVGTLSKEDGERVKNLYTDPLRSLATKINVEDDGSDDEE